MAVVAGLVVLCGTVQASGIMVPKDRELPPLAVKSHRVTVQVQDGVATTRVSQTFLNSTGHGCRTFTSTDDKNTIILLQIQVRSTRQDKQIAIAFDLFINKMIGIYRMKRRIQNLLCMASKVIG